MDLEKKIEKRIKRIEKKLEEQEKYLNNILSLLNIKEENNKINNFQYVKIAKRILQKFNQITKSHYRPVKTNLELIIGRLKEEYTIKDIIITIKFKAKEWLGDSKMDVYLRPYTIFNKTKFSQYHGKAITWWKNKIKAKARRRELFKPQKEENLNISEEKRKENIEKANKIIKDLLKRNKKFT